MSVKTKTQIGVIDLTPTWEAMTVALVFLIEDGDSEGKEFARKELARMAKLADAYVALQKEK